MLQIEGNFKILSHWWCHWIQPNFIPQQWAPRPHRRHQVRPLSRRLKESPRWIRLWYLLRRKEHHLSSQHLRRFPTRCSSYVRSCYLDGTFQQSSIEGWNYERIPRNEHCLFSVVFPSQSSKNSQPHSSNQLIVPTKSLHGKCAKSHQRITTS